MQGFQLIVDGGNPLLAGTPGQPSTVVSNTTSAVVGPRSQDVERAREYKLSIGRVFHRIVLNGSEIRVTRYRPRYCCYYFINPVIFGCRYYLRIYLQVRMVLFCLNFVWLT